MYSSLGETYALFPNETQVLEQVGIGLGDLLAIIFGDPDDTLSRPDANDAGRFADNLNSRGFPIYAMDVDSVFVNSTGSYLLANGDGSFLDPLGKAKGSGDWNQESMNTSTNHMLGTAKDENNVLLGLTNTICTTGDSMYTNGGNTDGGHSDYAKGSLWGKKQSEAMDKLFLSDVLLDGEWQEDPSKKPLCECTYCK